MPVNYIFYAVVSAVFAALVGVFGKVGLKDVDSTLATTIRSVIMAVFLCGVAVVFGKFENIGTLQGKSILFIVLSGIAGALSWIAYFYALKYGPASVVSAIDRTSVVFVFVLSVLFLAEKFTLVKLLGAVLITTGAIVMAL